MAEKVYSHELKRTKEANLVIPLDEVRTIDVNTTTIASGAFPTSGILYTIVSGKEAYIRQIWVTELSGQAGSFQIADPAGNIYTPPIKVAGGQDKVINTCLGPATSGFVVASGAPIAGTITLVVQVDPKAPE